MNINDLRSFPIFGDYSDQEFEEYVVPFLTELNFSAGEFICRERAQGDSCFFLAMGDVEVQTALATGEVEVIGQLEPGHVFGQLVLLDGGLRSASCVAGSDCRLFELTRDDFDALRVSGNRFAFDLLIEIAHSLAGQLRQATKNLGALSEARVEDPASLSKQLESVLRGEDISKYLKKTTESGLLRLKDFEL